MCYFAAESPNSSFKWMNVERYLGLENEFDFKRHCAQSSIQAFKVTIEQGSYPSRYQFLCLLIKDIFTTPLYLAKKIAEIVLNIWNLTHQKDLEGNSFHPTQSFEMIVLASLQFFIPLVCTAIRLCATALGLFFPRWAMEGWIMAEGGETLSCDLWASHLKQSPWHLSGVQACEDIYPSNAIFYLGMEQTHLTLNMDAYDYDTLEYEITSELSNLLNYILESNVECFRKLLFYEEAEKTPHQISKYSISYFISSDTKYLIKVISKSIPRPDREEKTFIQDKHDEALLDAIFKEMPPEKLYRIFSHVCLNLQAMLIDERDLNLDRTILEGYFTNLKDLFSKRFYFGRAHFSQTTNHLLPYMRV